jgi:hypothetical protein
MKRYIVGWVSFVVVLACGAMAYVGVVHTVCGESLWIAHIGSGIALALVMVSFTSQGFFGGSNLGLWLMPKWQLVTIRAIYRDSRYTNLLVEMNPGEIIYIKFKVTDDTGHLIEGYHYRWDPLKRCLSQLPVGKQ